MRIIDVRELIGYCVGKEGVKRVEGTNLAYLRGLVQKGIREKDKSELYIVSSGEEVQKDGRYQKVVASVCRGPLEGMDLTQASENGGGYLIVHLEKSRYATMFPDREITKGTSRGYTFDLHDPYEESIGFYLSFADAEGALLKYGLQDGEIADMMEFISEEGL